MQTEVGMKRERERERGERGRERERERERVIERIRRREYNRLLFG